MTAELPWPQPPKLAAIAHQPEILCQAAVVAAAGGLAELRQAACQDGGAAELQQIE